MEIGRRGGGDRKDEKGMREPRMSRTEFGSRGQGSVSGVAGRRGRRAKTSNWKFSCAIEAPWRPPQPSQPRGQCIRRDEKIPLPPLTGHISAPVCVEGGPSKDSIFSVT